MMDASSARDDAHWQAVRGSLVQRGRQTIIAVNEVGDWIRREDVAIARPADPALARPEPLPLGE